MKIMNLHLAAICGNKLTLVGVPFELEEHNLLATTFIGNPSFLQLN